MDDDHQGQVADFVLDFTHGSACITHRLSYDSTIDEVVEAFARALMAVGFSPELVEDRLPDSL